MFSMFYWWFPRLITIPPLPDFNYGPDGVCDVLEQDVFTELRSSEEYGSLSHRDHRELCLR